MSLVCPEQPCSVSVYCIYPGWATELLQFTAFLTPSSSPIRPMLCLSHCLRPDIKPVGHIQLPYFYQVLGTYSPQWHSKLINVIPHCHRLLVISHIVTRQWFREDWPCVQNGPYVYIGDTVSYIGTLFSIQCTTGLYYDRRCLRVGTPTV